MTGVAGVAGATTSPQRRRMRRDAVAITAAVVLVAVVAVALLGPWLAPRALGQTVGRPFDPSGPGWLGTEVLGRDVWSRLLASGRRIVLVPLVITVMTTLIGTVLGTAMAASKLAGGLLRSIDVLAVIPPLVVLLVLLHRLGGSLLVVGLAVIVVSVPYVARFMRAAAEPVLDSGYVLQARLAGDPRRTILWRDVLPNLAGPMLADTALRLSGTVYVVAAASFLGFGPPSPQTDWAAMVNENLAGIKLNVWGVAAPALAIAAFTVPLNLLADRLAARVAHR